MQGSELDRRARVRAQLRTLVNVTLSDLDRLGFTEAQLKGKNLPELLELKEKAIARLMSAPRSYREAA